MDWYKEQWWNISLFAQAALSIFFFSVVSCPLEASLSSSCEAPDSAGFGWKIRGGTLFLADYMCFKTFLENSHVRTCSLTRTMAHTVQRLSKKKKKKHSVYAASSEAWDSAETWKAFSWNGSLISQRTIRPAIAVPWSQWWHSTELCLDRFLQAFTLRGYEFCCSPLTASPARYLFMRVRAMRPAVCVSVKVSGSAGLVGSGFLFFHFTPLFSPLLHSLVLPHIYMHSKWGFTLTLEPHQIGSSCEESAGRASPWWAFLKQSRAANRASEQRFIAQ